MPDSSRTLIDDLLAEQGQITAVEQFARAHEAGKVTRSLYQHLLPLTTPRPGEQYAFEVNLDQCSGCKACVTACHALNGLDDDEMWRETGSLQGEILEAVPTGGNRVVPLQQTVTTACHHCVEPACLEGCPVLAYDKDPVTGIVRHLDDQCIGCSYCILKCPYEVPKYSAKRGIVRKCDMCHGRLEVGEAPACVQACPNEAIKITLVQSSSLATTLGTSTWLPDAPAPDYTLPTTHYVTRQPNAKLLAADHSQLKLQPAHWPLICMLILTQAGIGSMMWGLGVTSVGHRLLSSVIFATGLVFSVLHLGQPAKAWRVWLGWKTSWLSREAIVLNALAAIMGLQFVGLRFPWLALVLVAGLALYCQAMVYADTRRKFWALRWTLPRFIGTAVLLGTSIQLVLAPTAIAVWSLMAATLLKLGCELAVLKFADDESASQLQRTGRLQTQLLRPVLTARILLGLAGGLILPFFMLTDTFSFSMSLVSAGLCLFSEFAERYLFFTSVAPDKMPGNFGS
ncbi:MAG TPA: 4Fe-4S dicluster domain-containing protein [Candidatus Saccharimonadales bacterium]|nr:4Fe-4S dicluster domain-containing protein [Candidatus Saccharimonadales bacterium]